MDNEKLIKTYKGKLILVHNDLVLVHDIYNGTGFVKVQYETQTGVMRMGSVDGKRIIIFPADWYKTDLYKTLARAWETKRKQHVYETPDNRPDLKKLAADIVGHLNTCLNELKKPGEKPSAFRVSTEAYKLISGRFADGYKYEDFITVINKKIKSWGKDPKMSPYLNPVTLFRPSHFDKYLNEFVANAQSNSTFEQVKSTISPDGQS